MNFFKKKIKTEEPVWARFMVDRGQHDWLVFQKIDGMWLNRGNAPTLEAAVDRVKELRDYPMYFK